MTEKADDPSEFTQAAARYAAGLGQLSAPGGDISNAAALIRRAGEDGHPEACALLALMQGMGVGMAQDWRAALDHLERAACLGSAAARGQLLVLADDSARPTGIREDDAALWTRLRQSVNLEPWLSPPLKRVLSTAPRAVAIEGFVSQAVCRWLIGKAEGRVRPALVYDGDAAGHSGSGRSNSAFEFAFLDLDLVTLLVRARIAATIGVPVGLLESTQVLNYQPGEQFARHFDFLDPGQPGHAAQIAAQGQRIVTFLVYLNDGYEGGETDFPRIGLRHRGGAGDALYFGNIDAAGAPDPRTLHAGLAPTKGEKWLLSQWIRDRPRR